MTVAMSLLVHGEAVRFNRGQSRGDDFDFKYMRGRDGKEYPYVSSQCYKKYWRESLPLPFSPIIREKDAGGKEKNQAYTSGNPIKFLDDDLFGYMIAGASEAEEENETEVSGNPRRIFEDENLRDAKALMSKLTDKSPLSNFILACAPGEAVRLTNAEPDSDLLDAMLNLLDEAARRKDLVHVEGVKKNTKEENSLKKASTQDDVRKANRDILRRTFSKELQEKAKRDTTKRTAPIRMHALVAFSGIKTARDFQTFSRDVAYTGSNSIMNPAPPGIYSGWLKTRILIESHRIGKFYVGKNMDIRDEEATGSPLAAEINPYSREQETVRYVQLEETERTKRLRAAIRALADIGNRQGPASGALHDGSLRPKAFVAGLMNCADSPFDYVWTARNDDNMPDLDIARLCEEVKDWNDLFQVKRIYVGLPGAADAEETIKAELGKFGFEAVVDTPRRALLSLEQQASA
jgi:hypothetical protein